MRMRNVVPTLGLAMVVCSGSLARAAPTMSVTQLPVDDQLMSELAARGRTQEQIQDFFSVLAGIRVYDDHQNPADTGRNDRSRAKVYWTAPYFAASQSRSVVGAEQFATSALKVLDDTDLLLDSFNFLASEELRLKKQRSLVEIQITQIITSLANPSIPQALRDSLNTLLTSRQAEAARLDAEIMALRQQGSQGAQQLPDGLRRSIADGIILAVSRLGVTPNPTEESQIYSANTSDLILGLASVRARAGEGQFGLRQTIYEAGLSPGQLSVVSLYLQLRPDVTLRGLTVQATFVRPAAQTLVNQESLEITRNGVMQLRGVNLGNGGTCGSTLSCNVVVEYTDTGARDSIALLGAITVPVTFEANVRVLEPDFVGSIHCHFRTGWVAQGRADVKDGAIIYDGDLTNKIKYESLDDEFGGCEFTIQEGSEDSAFYHAMKDIDRYYRALHAERQHAAKQEKDAYRHQIEQELLWHQRNSQSRPRGGWFSDVFGIFVRGRIFVGVAGFLIGGARDLYWHTTTLDTANIDEINMRQTYNVRNVTATRRFAFDGSSIVCHDQQLGEPKVIRACSDREEVDDPPNTEPDDGNENCPPGLPLELCGF